MTAVLISLIAVFMGLGAVAMIVIGRGKEIKLLAEDGVDVMGEVVDMPKFGRPTNAKKYRHIRYRYKDAAGVEHVHRVQVTTGESERHTVGGPIAVVYSRSKPGVSAMKSLVDPAREALRKR